MDLLQTSLNMSHSRSRRHYSYVAELNEEKCSTITDTPFAKRKEFFEQTEDCEDEGIIPYKEIMYIYLKPQSREAEWGCLILYVLFLSYIFVILGSVTDKYFCPSLKALSKVFHMSENIAGVTLLAFGNGSPDLFSSLAQIDQDISVGKIFTEVISGCMFVAVLISGIILIVKPFILSPSTFLRDSFFLIFSLLFLEWCIEDGDFSLNETIWCIVIYIAYIIVVGIDQFLLSYTEKKLRAQLRSFNPLNDRVSLESLTSQLDDIQSELDMDYGMDRRLSFAPQVAGKNYLIMQLIDSLKPFDFDEFKEKSIIEKAQDLFFAPANVFLACFIPLVDLDEERNGWSKLLHCIHWVTLPAFFFFVSPDLHEKYALIGCVLGAGVVVGLIVFKTSNTYAAPSYHFIYYIFSSAGSMFFVYWLADNVVAILEVIGFITSLSKSFLGTTFLAVGNSLGDLLADVSLARSGYQKMAFAACFGGPLFNVIFGSGVTFTFKIIKENTVFSLSNSLPATKGSLGNNMSLLVIVGLIGFVATLCLTNFVSRRMIGVFNITIYFIAFILNCLCEGGIMHALGADHKFDNID